MAQTRLAARLQWREAHQKPAWLERGPEGEFGEW